MRAVNSPEPDRTTFGMVGITRGQPCVSMSLRYNRRLNRLPSNSLRVIEFSPSFVLMQYYGYLRRNPADGPDTDDNGYQFWLTKLNNVGGDFRRADMLKAFIMSKENRSRFVQP